MYFKQPNQMNMAVFFWHLVKSDFASVRYCTLVHGTRNKRPCINGHPVYSRSLSGGGAGS